MLRIQVLAAVAALAVAIGTPAAAQAPPPKVTATLADYLEMPLTGAARADEPRSQITRINVLREEPGAGRLFVNDQTGQLYIVDKRSRRVVPYLNLNGSGEAPGLFPRLVADTSFASGFFNFAFDPDYRRNGVFYTVHMEDVARAAPAAPKAGVPGVDVSNYVLTPAIMSPIGGGAQITREAVLAEWTDSNVSDTRFEGRVREVLRVQLMNGVHPMGDVTFDPTARRGGSEWRVMYFSVGDSGGGETPDVRRLIPQRLDSFGGKIMRIVADPREHVSTSRVSASGAYRIPNDNPFVATPGARGEIWAYGMRNPHRLSWDAPAARGGRANLLAYVIGSNGGQPRYETINIVRRGANYGYPLREGSDDKPLSPIYGPLADDDTLPLRISDTVTLNERTPIRYSSLQYATGAEGLAIAGGFVYRGRKFPALRGAVVFGDITSGGIFYARMADLNAATDDDPATMAPFAEIATDLRARAEARYRQRVPNEPYPASAPIGPRARLDMRLATDADGEIYILTKSDGMVRRIESIQ